MPGFTVTRGFGPNAPPSAFILQGFGPGIVAEAVRIIRGGRSAASRAIKDLTESFKISAMLIEANGKEFADPIFNVVKKTFSESALVKVSLIPKKLIARRSENIKVIVENVKVRKNDGND